MKVRLLIFLCCLLPGRPAQGQTDLLHAGPMLAYTDLRSTAVWVQTTRSAEVQLRYWIESSPEQARLTPITQTEDSESFCVTFVLADLEPGTSYGYELYLEGTLAPRPYPLRFRTQPLWHWRSDPPAFSAAIGSCAYVNDPPYDRPGKPYGSETEIFQAINARSPDLMIWLGDNVYLREVDYGTEAGLRYRYRHARADRKSHV